ncbi:hypothetical protein CB0940_10465 [Cercospora beticola]|nr:hypothetical protein CB0940_10465 [Cercospora beticola]PIA96176.1 hypothetical protein CB0940_10465 [Cercospora beticola]
MTTDGNHECFFLTRLPGELRSLIYSHILTFSRPLKLRQIVAGSPNTSILRTSSQIYSEALPVFYSCNTILCSRNDFCQHTDSEDLQTPLHRKDQIQNLLVKNFSQSIKCSSYSGGNNMFLAGCCEVCQPTATGFLQVLTSGYAFPKLKSVVIDYHNHVGEFGYVKDVMRRNAKLETLRLHRELVCTGMGQFELRGTSIVLEGLKVVFRDVAMNEIWNQFEKLESSISIYGMPDEVAILQKMREDYDRDLPDQLYFLMCGRKSMLWPRLFEVIDRLWKNLDKVREEREDEAVAMEELYDEVVRLTRRFSRNETNPLLMMLRTEEGIMASQEVIDLLTEFQKREGVEDVTQSMAANVVAASLAAASEGHQVVKLYRHVCKDLPLEKQKLVQRRMKEAILKTGPMYGSPKMLQALFPLFKDLKDEEIDHYGPSHKQKINLTKDESSRHESINGDLTSPSTPLIPPHRHELGQTFFTQLWGSPSSSSANQAFNLKFHPDLHFLVSLNLAWIVAEDTIFSFAETCMLNSATMFCSNNAEQAMWHVRGIVRQGGTREQAQWTQDLALRVAEICEVRVKRVVPFEEIAWEERGDHTR